MVESRFTSADYDVDVESGFFPRKPLPRLPQPFEIWEKAFSDAPEVLYLGDDNDNAGKKEWTASDTWRRSVNLVSVLCKGD